MRITADSTGALREGQANTTCPRAHLNVEYCLVHRVNFLYALSLPCGMDWCQDCFLKFKKIAVDSGEEPVYNTARSVPAEVRWGNLLLNQLPAG
jgi:hypothetical protein